MYIQLYIYIYVLIPHYIPSTSTIGTGTNFSHSAFEVPLRCATPHTQDALGRSYHWEFIMD